MSYTPKFFVRWSFTLVKRRGGKQDLIARGRTIGCLLERA